MEEPKRSIVDTWERAVASVFRPGSFVPEGACRAFVSDLAELETEVQEGMADRPERATSQYELLLAACYEKASEVDDSCGNMAGFVEGLFRGWVRARQATKADPRETARWLLARMDEDPHGFCQHLEREVVKELGEGEQAEFRRGLEIRAGVGDGGGLQARGTAPQRWVEALRAFYFEFGHLEAYVALAESAGVNARHCQEMAEMLVARDQLNEALGWVERGLGLRGVPGGYGLEDLRRSLLVSLGRADEALDSAWEAFKAFPHCYTCETLEALIPEADRWAWRERILEVVGRSGLERRMELLLVLQELDLMASLVEQTPDLDLEGLGHKVGEPAAAALEREHPGLSARLWRAQALRILHAKRSKYYDVAILDLAHARDGFLAAGQGGIWEQTVAQMRAEHRRKLGFMEAFEQVAAGATPVAQPTFLERAKARWLEGWVPCRGE